MYIPYKEPKVLKNASILITGGTGSFGHTFIPMTLEKYNPKKVLLESLTDRNQYGSLVLDMGSYTLCNKSCKEFKIVEALNLQSEFSKIDWKDDSWLNIVAEYFNGTVVRSSVLSM